MDIKLVETPEAFDLPEWRLLVERDGSRHFFALPEWHRTWWEEFGSGKRLAVLIFLDPEPVGLAGLMIDSVNGRKRLRFLGGDDLTDYLGPVVPNKEKMPKVAHSLVDYLLGDLTDWDYFEAKALPVPFGFADWLAEAADSRHLSFSVSEEELTVVLPLPRSFDEYLASLTNKNRHELRRKLRRFERELPQAEFVSSQPATGVADVESFVTLHLGSQGLKGKFFLPERATFFRKLARVFGPREVVRIDFLKSEGVTIASTFSFEFERTVYLYNSAYDPQFKAASPGLVLVAKLIERSIAKGHDRFDFLRGRERYKFDLGGQPLPLHSVRIERS